ncbi:DegV family protein [uncultured Streptococcus sp.]|uniref:DegV family protein n=1 Tax=uncultured Streptococcus sp. TaxID=83427 RepID=UPI0028EFEA72|nr:DegV family protein [uncultured Streptococcus sp.]
MTWKIVTDSGCDIKHIEAIADHTEFQNVPLTIQIGSEIFVDGEGLDVDNMMASMYASHTSSKSSCPSPDAFLQAYQGAENVIAITITGNLSGSQNSAQVAKNMLLEEHPNVNIHVIDSLSAGGEIDLIVLELNRLIAKGLSFDEVVEAITAYQAKTKLLFILARVDNLVKNGRLSKLIGKVIGLLNIRMVGKASDEGTLELLHKARGQKKAVQATIDEMFKEGYQGGKVMITHANNEKACQQLSDKIKEKYPQADITFIKASGLCSFYGEDGGILLGYETK